MKFFIAAFTLNLRRLLRRMGTLAVLLLLPILTLALGILLPEKGAGSNIQVGVFIPENSPSATLFWERLGLYSNEQVTYIKADTLPQLEALVGNGKWECAYVLSESFDTHVQNNQYNEIVTCVTSPASTLSSVLNWGIKAALLDIAAPGISAKYLDESGILPQERHNELAPLIDKYFVAGGLMEIDIQQVNGAPLPKNNAAGQTGALLVRGFVALLLFLFSWLCAVQFSKDLTSGFFTRLQPYVHPARLYFPAYAASTTLSVLAGGLSLVLAGFLFPAFISSRAREAVCFAFYLILLGAFSYLLSVLFTGRDTLVALLPFVLIACLVLCPIVINLSQYFPIVNYISILLPPTYYLRAIAGSNAAMWAMPLLSAGLLVLGLTISHARAVRRVAV